MERKWKRILFWWLGYNNKNNNIEFEIKNGKGNIKEYDDYGETIYEGEYSNGERNGKGKEYYSNGGFEGEYLNGKKWNGTGYRWGWDSSNIIYEIKNGKGKNIKEYNSIHLLIFEGEYLNGEKNGKGKEYHGRGYNNVEFDGEYI